MSGVNLAQVPASVGAGCARGIERLSGTPSAPRWRGWVHLAALAAALPAAALLVAHDPTSAATIVYSVALVVLYALSSAYHVVAMPPAARRWVRRADHAYIYVFIAACYAPLCLRALPPVSGEVLLGVVWFGAAAGVTVKLVGFERARRPCGVLYALLGCLVVAAAPDVLRALDTAQLVLLGSMGLAYGAGVIVLAKRRPDPFPQTLGYHEIWHASVVIASACYYALVWSLAAPRP